MVHNLTNHEVTQLQWANYNSAISTQSLRNPETPSNPDLKKQNLIVFLQSCTKNLFSYKSSDKANLSIKWEKPKY